MASSKAKMPPESKQAETPMRVDKGRLPLWGLLMGAYEEVHIRDLSHVEDTLRNSFQAVKRDMDQLKTLQAIQRNVIQELQRRLEELRAEAIFKDKYNLLQIKLSDLEEELRQATKVDEDLAALKSDIKEVGKENKGKFKEFTKKQRKEFKEHQRLVDRDVQFVSKKIEDHLVRFDEHLQESVKSIQQRVNAEVRQMRTEVGKFSSILEENKKITADIEMVRKEMEKLQKQGGDIFEKQVGVYKRTIDDKLLQIKTGLETLSERQKEMSDNVGKELAKRVGKDQVEKLVDDVNREFNNLKQLVRQDFAKIEEEVKKKGKFVRTKAMEKMVRDINDEFDKLRDKMGNLEEGKIAKNTFDQHLEEVQADMENIRDELNVMKNEAMGDKERRTELKAELKKLKKRVPKPRIMRRMMLVSHGLLIVAFTLVIVALATYFTGFEPVSKFLLAGGVLLFVAGAILRIAVAVKSKEEEA